MMAPYLPPFYREFFIGRLVAGLSDGKEGGSGDFPAWAAPERKASFAMLSRTFPHILQAFSLKDPELWGAWAKSSKCEVGFFEFCRVRAHCTST